MAIVKFKNHWEIYAARSKNHLDSHYALSGRRERDATIAINRKIISSLQIMERDVVLDIGCGDGSLLDECKDLIEYGFGTLPSQEEIERLVSIKKDMNERIKFVKGKSEKLSFQDNYFNKVICNGVFLLLNSYDEVVNSMREIHRVSENGSLVYIGEVLEEDIRDNLYDDNVFSWLLKSLKSQGALVFFQNALKIVKALIGTEDLLIIPKLLVIKNDEFIKMASKLGFKVLNVSKSISVLDDKIVLNKYRNDYLLKVIKK